MIPFQTWMIILVAVLVLVVIWAIRRRLRRGRPFRSAALHLLKRVSDFVGLDPFVQLWAILTALVAIGDFVELLRGVGYRLIVYAILLAMTLYYGRETFKSKRRLERTMRALYEITRGNLPPVKISEVHWNYWIESDRLDHAACTEISEPVDQPVPWRDFFLGVIGEGEAVASLDDLEIETSCADHNILVLPVDETNKKHLHAALFFIPPITSVVSFTLHYTWPDTWKPLWQHGEDAGRLQVRYDAGLVRLKIFFPKEMKSPRFVSIFPRVGTTRDGSEGGRQYLEWEMTNVPPGAFDYRVAVDRT